MDKRKADLNDVTLCAVDCRSPDLALSAIRRSLIECSFNKAILFTDSDIDVSDCDLVRIKRIESVNDYSLFLLKRLFEFVETDFVLVIQWDGFVIDGSAWRPEFRNYDYIGAKWPWHKDGATVGNGGFSLRSRKLLNALGSGEFSFQIGIPEDEQICRKSRDVLSRTGGIRFAEESVADFFSYERALPEKRTFGFHGLFNMWRHCEDGFMIELVGQLPASVVRSREAVELIIQYFILRKMSVLEALYLKLRSFYSTHDLVEQIAQVSRNREFAVAMNQFCENSLK